MSKTELKKLSKDELEELGRENGLELDKRLTKGKLVDQLFEVVGGGKKEKLVNEYIHGKRDFTWSGKLLADASGKGYKFATRSLAKWHGDKHGGKPVAEGKYFIVHKY